MEELKNIIAQNIYNYRIAMGITQIELAQRLNYSDKSISKWERGASVPDVYVLKQMAELFGVKVDDLLIPHEGHKVVETGQKRANKLLITLLAAGLVWLVATLVYVVLLLFRVPHAWKSFIYALPATAVVLIVFSALWGKQWHTCLASSLCIWTVLGSIYITFLGTRAWLWFLIGIPLQILTLLWFALMFIKRRYKNNKKS